jgi:hypothetical protein
VADKIDDEVDFYSPQFNSFVECTEFLRSFLFPPFLSTLPHHGVRRSVAPMVHLELELCPKTLGASSSSIREQSE